MKNKEQKIIYYSDESNDDFAGTNIKTQKIDKNFNYRHTHPVWKFLPFLPTTFSPCRWSGFYARYNASKIRKQKSRKRI